MAMTKAASRDVAKMSETAFETQAAFVTLGVGEEAFSLAQSASRWKTWDVTMTSTCLNVKSRRLGL